MPLANGIAIFGGTFDPVHFGHLRSAVEVREALGVDSVKLVPSFVPPHRGAPVSTPRQRLDMLRLSVQNVPGLEVDTRELDREGASYAVDTLRSIREEQGEDIPLTMIIGSDAFCSLHEWHDWRHLLDYAHIAVIERPRYADSEIAAELRTFTVNKFVNDPLCLRTRPSGFLCRLRLTPIDISATMVRDIFSYNRSPAFLMPDEVIFYIRKHGLYGASSHSPQERSH